MALKGRAERLIRQATKDMARIDLRDGTTRVFDDMEVFKEMFLVQTELFRGRTRPSEILEAARAATPESREAFEEEYGPICKVARVIAADYQGGWVDEYKLFEDGTVEKTHHEGAPRGPRGYAERRYSKAPHRSPRRARLPPERRENRF
jgi:hypothetical protein